MQGDTMAQTQVEVKKNGAEVQSTEVREVQVPLNQIAVNYDWNVRNKDKVKQPKADEAAPENEASTGAEGMADSIASRGQDTAVELMPTADKDLAKTKPFTLVAGFRRVEGMSLLAARSIANNVEFPIASDPSWSAKHPTIRAKVRTHDALSARLLNLAENTARDDLSGPDLMFGILDAMALYKRTTGKDMSVNELSKVLSKNQSYLNKLYTIGTEMPKSVREHWRVSRNPLPYAVMYDIVKQVPSDRREEEYKAKCAGQAGAGEGETKDPNAWVETAKARAEANGKMLGRLHAIEAFDGSGIEWGSVVRELASFKKSATAKQTSAISKAAKRGFLAGIKEVEKEGEAEAEEAEEGE